MELPVEPTNNVQPKRGKRIVTILIGLVAVAAGYFVGSYTSRIVWGEQVQAARSQYTRKTGFPFQVAVFRFTSPDASTIAGCKKVNLDQNLCGIGVAQVGETPGCAPNIGACWNDVASNFAKYLNMVVFALAIFLLLFAAYTGIRVRMKISQKP